MNDNKPYTIFWDYGSEGWRLHDSNFDTPEEALLAAMDDPAAPFLIVKKIVFTEVRDE